MARVVEEREPRARLIAAVEIAVEAPSRFVGVLEIVLNASEHDLRAIALKRLLEGGSDRLAAEVVAAVPAALPQARGVALLLRAARGDPRAA